MKCPACDRQTSQRTVEEITVDVCEGGCGGIWFDQFEFKKFDEPHEKGGEALLEIARDPSISVDRAKRLQCPQCPNVVMMRHFSSSKRQVEVDECPTCAGLWLDVGELAHIRSLFPSEEARLEAGRAYMREVLGDKLAAHREERDETTQKYLRIAHIFRFICPSNYIPGKQDGGAF
jgi:Zn-finger nucleic acid-binding protein